MDQFLDGGRPSSADVSDDMVTKVGTAAVRVVEIRQSYTPRIVAARSQAERDGLEEQATAALVEAISEQGLSVDEYNEVVAAAQADPELERRLLTAASEA
jgi:uncharacterized protein DUF4168